MDYKLSERYIDACMRAKKTTRFLPEPPEGLQRRHIYIIKTCFNLREQNGEVKVSDIAQAIGGTMPSVTKNIAALEEKGYLVKVPNKEDKRITNLEITPKGLALHKEMVIDYHIQKMELLRELPEEDIVTTIETINKIYQLYQDDYHKNSEGEL